MRIFASLLLLGSLLAPAAHAATLKIATLAPDGTSWMKVMRQAFEDYTGQEPNVILKENFAEPEPRPDTVKPRTTLIQPIREPLEPPVEEQLPPDELDQEKWARSQGHIQ